MSEGDDELGNGKNPALQDRGLARPVVEIDEGETSFDRCERTRA